MENSKQVGIYIAIRRTCSFRILTYLLRSIQHVIKSSNVPLSLGLFHSIYVDQGRYSLQSVVTASGLLCERAKNPFSPTIGQFFNRKSSFTRGNPTLSLHLQ